MRDGADHEGGGGDDVLWLRAPRAHAHEVSVVTLVADRDRYARMRASARAHGFDRRAQFVALDNTDGNRWDGYDGLRRALPDCTGRYVLWTHDDVEFAQDGLDDLLGLLADLDRRDPAWALAGNAGTRRGGGRKAIVMHATDPERSRRIAEPVEVDSLDECFFVMRRDRPVPTSFGLEGFHLYASDMVLNAEALGGTAWAIPFHVRHHSAGRVDAAFDAARAAFRARHAPYNPGRVYRTPNTSMRFGYGALLRHRPLI